MALAHWKTLFTDDDARFDREVRLDAARIAPLVTWGTSPDDVAPVDGRVPDPAALEPHIGQGPGGRTHLMSPAMAAAAAVAGRIADVRALAAAGPNA